jgi:hypothetical protein
VQRLATCALGKPQVVGRPLLQLGIAVARQLAIDDGGKPPFAELALEFR